MYYNLLKIKIFMNYLMIILKIYNYNDYIEVKLFKLRKK